MIKNGVSSPPDLTSKGKQGFIMSLDIAKAEGIILNDSKSANHNAAIINALLAANGNPVNLPSGNIYVSDTLIIENRTLSGAGRGATRMIMIDLKKPVIELKNNAYLRDFDIILPAGYTDRAIKILSASKVDNGGIERLNITGKAATYTGTAIGTEGSGGWIQFLRFRDITIRFVKYGLLVNHSDRGYFNGCVLHNICFNNVTTAVYLNKANGNIFSDFMSEPSTETTTVFELINSSNNIFEGFVWDTPEHAKIFRFNYLSNNNTVYNFINDYNRVYIEDYGKQNRYIPNLGYSTGIKTDKNVLGIDKSGKNNYIPPVMMGEQDDILANAGKRYIVTASGAPIIGGTVEYAFGNTNPEYFVEFADPTSNPIVITIDGKKKSAFAGLQLIGICFSNLQIGRDIQFRLSQDGRIWNAGESIVNESSQAVVSLGDNFFDGFYCRYIRITISTPFFSDLTNVSKKVRISRIFACSNRMQGDKWIPRRGGYLMGDIELPAKSGVILTSPNGLIRKRLDIDNQGDIRLTKL